MSFQAYNVVVVDADDLLLEVEQPQKTTTNPPCCIQNWNLIREKFLTRENVGSRRQKLRKNER